MRITDVAYGTPVLGCAIVLVAVLGPSVWNVILVISMLLWRTTARSIRAQTLTLKERPFIWAAKAAGASPFRIMFVHIFPSVASLSFFYAALGVGGAVLSESGISFLGLGDPLRTSWGQMLYFAFITASIGCLLKPQATYRQTPTGGEISEIPTLACTKIPMCIGSIPKLTPTGTKIGISIIKAGKASIIMPSRKKTMFKNNTKIIQLSA